MDRPSKELAWDKEGRGRSLHEFWEDWNAEQEVQTEEEELRGEEPEAEEEREAKRPRCWNSMEIGEETATGDVSRGSVG